MTETSNISIPALQRRVRTVLMLGQVMAGLGMGATLAVGAIMVGRLAGSDGFSGLAATFSTLGAALAAVPLSRLAAKKGRSVSLTTGAMLASLGVSSPSSRASWARCFFCFQDLRWWEWGRR